jgi:hypothetical protein
MCRQKKNGSPTNVTAQVVRDLQIHHGTDPGEGVGESAQESAITQTRVGEGLDHVQESLDFAFNKCRGFAFGP